LVSPGNAIKVRLVSGQPERSGKQLGTEARGIWHVSEESITAEGTSQSEQISMQMNQFKSRIPQLPERRLPGFVFPTVQKRVHTHQTLTV